MLDGRRGSTLAGDVISLADQDRDLWDRDQIALGTAILDGAIAKGRIGEYQLQAAIAAIHDRAPRAIDTDWSQILALYGLLERMTGNPIVTLNRAVAAGMVHGPTTGLAMLDGVEGPSRATIGSTPSALTSSRWPARPMPRSSDYRAAPDGRPTCPSNAT